MYLLKTYCISLSLWSISVCFSCAKMGEETLYVYVSQKDLTFFHHTILDSSAVASEKRLQFVGGNLEDFMMAGFSSVGIRAGDTVVLLAYMSDWTVDLEQKWAGLPNILQVPIESVLLGICLFEEWSTPVLPFQEGEWFRFDAMTSPSSERPAKENLRQFLHQLLSKKKPIDSDNKKNVVFSIP